MKNYSDMDKEELIGSLDSLIDSIQKMLSRIIVLEHGGRDEFKKKLEDEKCVIFTFGHIEYCFKLNEEGGIFLGFNDNYSDKH